jgi:hypothetical protein
MREDHRGERCRGENAVKHGYSRAPQFLRRVQIAGQVAALQSERDIVAAVYVKTPEDRAAKLARIGEIDDEIKGLIDGASAEEGKTP